MKTRRTIPYITMCLCALLLAACDKNAHEGEVPPPAHGGIQSVLHVTFSMPASRPSDYNPDSRTRSASDNGFVLRCIAEICRAGTDEVVHRGEVLPTPEADGSYAMDFTLNESSYDIRLWADYVSAASGTSDHHYTTASGLKAVSIQTAPYTANTDTKDAAYAFCGGIALTDGDKTITAELQRPLAKYRLVATDIDRYLGLRKIDAEKYPPLDALSVTVVYEGYFPSGFNAVTGKPNNAVNGSGIFYSQPLPAIVPEDTEVQVGSDWVLVNGSESSVTVTVQMKDGDGNVVSQVSGVQIAYKRGCLTTVRGEFLSAGRSGGGIHIDTEWEGEYNVDF